MKILNKISSFFSSNSKSIVVKKDNNNSDNKINILPFAQNIYQIFSNSSIQEQYNFVVKDQNVRQAVSKKVQRLFNKKWTIKTIDDEITIDDERNIKEIKAYLLRENAQDKDFISALQNILAQKYSIGIGYLYRTSNENNPLNGNFFYDDIIPGSIIWNIDKKGRLLNPPYYVVSNYNKKQYLDYGQVIKLDSPITNQCFYKNDFRSLLPISPLLSMISLLMASELVDCYEAGIFKNGILPGSVIETPEGTNLQSAEIKELFEFLMARYSLDNGQQSAFKYEIKDIRTGGKDEITIPFGAPLILPNGFKLKDGLKPSDFSKPELKRYIKLEIFGNLGFPIELIPGMERNSSLGSGKSIEEANNNYEQHENNPEKQYIGAKLTNQLFKKNEHIYNETQGKYGFKLTNGQIDLSRYVFHLPEVPNKQNVAIISQFTNSISKGVKFTQREARSLFLPYMEVNDNEKLKDVLDSIVEMPNNSNPLNDLMQTKNINKAKEIPMKIYKSDERGYVTIDKEIKSLENQTNVGIETIIRTIIEKYFKDVKNKAYNEKKNSYDLKAVSKIKLKDLNKLLNLLTVQGEKAWEEGKKQALNDPNVQKHLKKNNIKKEYKNYNYNDEIVKIENDNIIIKANENDAAGTWDYSQLDETIILLSQQQTDRIAGKLVADLRLSIQKAIRQNIPVDDLVNSILSSNGELNNTLTKVLNFAYTEARTSLSETRQQARFKMTEDIGAEYFQIDATLDDRTTEICQKLNGVIIKASELSEFAPGLPPYHYNCRTEINSIFKEDLKKAVNDLGSKKDDLFGNEQYIQDVNKIIPEGFQS